MRELEWMWTQNMLVGTWGNLQLAGGETGREARSFWGVSSAGSAVLARRFKTHAVVVRRFVQIGKFVQPLALRIERRHRTDGSKL